MLRNYLTIALRHALRQKVHAAINVAGLAIGMACFLLIVALVRVELSYDGFHEDADRIFRMVRRTQHVAGGPIRDRANTGAALGSLLRAEFPGIEHVMRLGRFPGVVRCEGQRYSEPWFFFAEPDFLKVFSLPALRGSPEMMLDDPFSVVLSQEAARRYFGEMILWGGRSPTRTASSRSPGS